MGRKLERHAERVRAGGRKAHFSSSTGRKTLVFRNWPAKEWK